MNKHISDLDIKASLASDDVIPIYDSATGENKGIKLVDLIATLNNMTLESPVINTPSGLVKSDVGLSNVDNTSDSTKDSASVTLSNKTLTTPKIDTITEETAANGVTIDGLNIKDGKLNTNDSVVTANITDSNVTTNKLADNAITDDKLDYPRFWQEIARTTLAVAGDTITVSDIPARTYLRFILKGIATGGTLDTNIRFNNDSGANYAGRWDSAGIHSTSVSVTSLPMESGNVADTGTILASLDFINIATYPKVGTFMTAGVATVGAGTAPSSLWGSLEWVNTADKINSITWTNAGTGNFVSSSEIVVLGHD